MQVEKEFVTRLVISNSHLITAANRKQIRAVSETYGTSYRACKEAEGYIFREETHHTGIDGHHSTLRELLLSVAQDGNYRVFIEIEE